MANQLQRWVLPNISLLRSEFFPSVFLGPWTPHMWCQDWYGEAQYGFYDLTISKKEIFIESVNYDGEVLLTHTVYPSR